MGNFTPALKRIGSLLLFILLGKVSLGQNSPQTLRIEDFAVWGGSSAATSYTNSQGVTIGNSVTIQGNVGTNHLIDAKNSFTLTGNIYSGNVISLGSNGKITGDIFAFKSATNAPSTIITGANPIDFVGNLTSKGKIVLQQGLGAFASIITGKVAVPSPTSSNYSGPNPSGGIVNVNTVTLPTLPTMPAITAYDDQTSNTNISGTQILSPGVYKKLALTGNKTLTFNGPGDYIFNEVDNGTTANKLIFDFKNTADGMINIYIIKDAKWGKITVNMVNGNFPSRIYTEIHGTGSTNSGVAFELQGPGSLPSGNYSWLGSVWAPNGGIAVKSFVLSSGPQIIGALWSGKKVDLTGNIVLSYQPPAPSPAPVIPTLKLTDFAVWGGSGAANSYTNSQGVVLGSSVTIQGNVGTNHLLSTQNYFTLKGNLYSANAISIGNNGKITGDVFAAKTASNAPSTVISGETKIDFVGNLTAKGKIVIQSGIGSSASTILGKVAVPAPTLVNYSGPAPSGGIINTVTLPVFPSMPNITAFDNQSGSTNITNTQTISPGSYKKLALAGNKTLTFNGPGNYIFYEVDNGGLLANKLVFDFKNTTTGIINIFVVKDAKWGKITVNTVNGDFPSRIYTEVHGNGSTNSGVAFELLGPGLLSSGNYSWIGNVWVPNGGIAVKSFILSSGPQIVGALWSGKKVDLSNNVVLSYQAPAGGPSYVDPYYPPPANGKVAASNNVIGAELVSISQNTAPITSISDNEIFIIDNSGKVMIEVVSKVANDNALKSQLITLGMTGIIDNGPQQFVITGFFPINKLTQLNSIAAIQYVRPLYPPISNGGQVTTQGDVTMRSDKVRERFGLDGSGVKIGVLSDSYNSKLDAQNDIDQGDLPGIKSNGQPNENPDPVQIIGTDPVKGTDEGRAMLQIVHDIAPKAKLAFRTGFLTAGDFAKGIQELASPSLQGGRCDVIVDDITYVTEPFLRDGIAAQAVNQVVSQGVSYFSAAGNFGNKSYEAVFNGVTNTSIIPTGQIHKFGATNGDIYQTVNLKPGSYTIVLQWSDEFHSLGSTSGVQTDMDLYLNDANGFTLFGFNRSNLFGDPFEVCPFVVKEEINAKLMIVRAAGTGNVRFKYIIFRGDANILDYQTGTSTLVGQANADSAIAVGAMLYDNIPQYTPVWPGVASFSSRGGTFTLKGSSFAARNKPDLIGPNGVNTTVNLGGPAFDDGDPYPNFFGTSAAAPHVAAVGALLIQGRKKFNLQTTVTPYEIRQQLQSTAGKFSYLPGSFSYEGGYGYVQADSAIQKIANAKPIVDSMKTVLPGAQNGSVPFVVKVKGKYLTNDTKVYVAGVAITNTVVSPDKTEATATVPPITSGANPPFQLYNPAKSPSNLDGGLSEPLFFFGSRIQVLVKADNKTRKYGQENPALTSSISLVIEGDTIPIGQTNVTLADLKLDNLDLTTIATPISKSGPYGIFISRHTPLDNNDPILTQYGFTFISGTLLVEKMPLKITPENLQLKYGEYPGNIVFNYELDPSVSNSPTLLEEVKALHKKYLADNGLVVVNGLNNQNQVSQSDLVNLSMMASFQSVRNARKFIIQNGQLHAIDPIDLIDPSQIGDQKFIVDVSAQSLQKYISDGANSIMVQANDNSHARGLLNLKALTNGTAKAAIPNGQLQPMVNGQLLAMVNGQLQAVVNGQLLALVNSVYVPAEDLVFQNGQLLALVNNVWTPVANAQMQPIVNGQQTSIALSVLNGQLQALVNGTDEMQLVNGQLQALVNGQLLAIVNGQLQALVNGQLMPMVNGQLMAIVNGQLQPMVNGQLVAIVNGQLMALVNGQLEIIQDITLSNGQLQAIVNGQLMPMVNGQLKAMVNGVVTDIPTTDFSLVNGQLQAIVNGQLLAMVNGQLLAIVNGQLKPMVNGAAVGVESVKKLANGQLQALVNGVYIPITNGQLQAIVNGQLLAMVNGQLMAIVNNGNGDELTFVVFRNGQLQAMVNGQLQPMVNGQLQAIVNGQLQALVNSQTPIDNSYNITNGQLQAIVNGQSWAYTNGQLLAIVNGQLQALVNNFDVNGTNNNARTSVLVDQDDINLQSGDVGGMFSINMITGLDAGIQKLIPGAFVNENFEVTYGLGEVEILPSPLTAKANDTTKVYGDANPEFRISYSGFAYDDNDDNITPPVAATTATTNSGAGIYPITLSGGSSTNYSFAIYQDGVLTVGKKTLNVTADNKTKVSGDPNPALTISYNGLVGDDTKDSVCLPFVIPPTPKIINELQRRTTYTNVKINGSSNVFYASPGQLLTLTGAWNETFIDVPTSGCPGSGCVTQHRIGMANGSGGNAFATCDDVSGLSDHSGNINNIFNAPTEPGVYYITQISTWWYTCPAPNYGDPPQIPIHNNGAEFAIAVVVVNVSNTNITASTTADFSSPAGIYPITLQACNNYNPNYNVILHNGTLTVEDHCVNSTGHQWAAESNYDDEYGTGNGTAFGGVTTTGEGKVGAHSFSFNGSTGYIATGTGGSVSGTEYFTVSAWVKTTSTGPMVIINQRDANNNGEYILKIGGIHSYPFTPNPADAHPGKAYFLIFGSGSPVVDLISTTSVNDGNWHFIKGERDGTIVKLYVDGVAEATGNTIVPVSLNGSITTTIGKDLRDNNAYFNGLIDDIRVTICQPDVPLARSAPASTSHGSTDEVVNTYKKPEQDKLYPNPGSSVVRLELKDDVQNAKDIRIYDPVGKLNVVSLRKINDGLYEINVTKLQRGIYIIEARTTAGIKTFRFVKM